LPAAAEAQLIIKPPFLDGEKLVYEGKISRIIQGIAVADLTFTFGKTADGKNYLIETDARSKGTLIKLFRFSFLQSYDSTVDIEKFRILETVKEDVQRDRIRISVSLFDYVQNKVTFTESNPKEPMRAPRRIASDLKGDAQDLVSGIYYLRTLPLAIGKVFELTVSDSGLVYQVPVRVTAREIQKSMLGRLMCFRVEPEVFGNNRLIEQKGSMTIWITDDARRIPVRSRINSEFGKIEVRLKSVEPAKM
jgi:hypothetical protein